MCASTSGRPPSSRRSAGRCSSGGRRSRPHHRRKTGWAGSSGSSCGRRSGDSHSPGRKARGNVSPSPAREPGETDGGMMAGCVFCKIAAGEIPATIVKRADGMMAFQDLNPQAPTHLLVIPTDHLASLTDARDPHLLGRRLAFARDLARDAKLAELGYRVVVNTNPDGGQTVFHLHLHLLGGRAMTWPPG